MIVPGSNNLALALSIQGKEKINYFRSNGRTVNARGNYISAYEPPFSILGRFQAEQRTGIAEQGQELQRSIATIYLSTSMIDVTRNTQGDQVSYGGKLWQLLSNLEWNKQDRWASSIVAEQSTDPNFYYSLGIFQNPGVQPVTISNVDLSSPGSAVIDVQQWTLGAGVITPIQLTGAIPDGTEYSLKLFFNGEILGDITATAAGGVVSFSFPYVGMTNCCLRAIITPTVYNLPFDIVLSSGV